MRHLRKYVDVSGFTEPEEVVFGSQIGVYYPEGQNVFFPAVDHGDGTYTVTLGGNDVLFEDGLGIYENSDESGVIVPAKLTSGNPVSGTMENIMDPSGLKPILLRALNGEPFSLLVTNNCDGYTFEFDNFNGYHNNGEWEYYDVRGNGGRMSYNDEDNIIVIGGSGN